MSMSSDYMNFKPFIPNYNGYEYEAYINKMKTMSITKPTVYGDMRVKVIENLKSHGIEMHTTQNDSMLVLSMYRFSNPQIQGKLPLQGRCRLKADTDIEIKPHQFLKGSVVIQTKQALQ